MHTPFLRRSSPLDRLLEAFEEAYLGGPYKLTPEEAEAERVAAIEALISSGKERRLSKPQPRKAHAQSPRTRPLRTRTVRPDPEDAPRPTRRKLLTDAMSAPRPAAGYVMPRHGPVPQPEVPAGQTAKPPDPKDYANHPMVKAFAGAREKTLRVNDYASRQYFMNKGLDDTDEIDPIIDGYA